MKICRVQFPLELAYAITTNKSQGQTLDRVLLDTTTDCFSHGQLNVAFTRVRENKAISIYMDDMKEERVVILSVTWTELLSDSLHLNQRRATLRMADDITREATSKRKEISLTNEVAVQQSGYRNQIKS
jgi:hypothetical protein